LDDVRSAARAVAKGRNSCPRRLSYGLQIGAIFVQRNQSIGPFPGVESWLNKAGFSVGNKHRPGAHGEHRKTGSPPRMKPASRRCFAASTDLMYPATALMVLTVLEPDLGLQTGQLSTGTIVAIPSVI